MTQKTDSYHFSRVSSVKDECLTCMCSSSLDGVLLAYASTC